MLNECTVASKGIETIDICQSLVLKLRRPEPENGWKSAVHPEGQLYFYKNVSNGTQPSRRYITEANLNQKAIIDEIDQFQQTMESHISNYDLHGISGVEIVLELLPDNGGSWGYYMVDHTSQCLFWINDFRVDGKIEEDIYGIKSTFHLSEQSNLIIYVIIQTYTCMAPEYWMEKHYWKHWELFPVEKDIPPEVVSELMSILLHGSIGL